VADAGVDMTLYSDAGGSPEKTTPGCDKFKTAVAPPNNAICTKRAVTGMKILFTAAKQGQSVLFCMPNCTPLDQLYPIGFSDGCSQKQNRFAGTGRNRGQSNPSVHP
jgi:hypothetical protein